MNQLSFFFDLYLYVIVPLYKTMEIVIVFKQFYFICGELSPFVLNCMNLSQSPIHAQADLALA